MLRAVLPHFDKYPLRAKKARDYDLWRQIALLQAATYQRALTGGRLAEARHLAKQLSSGKRFKKGGTRWTRSS